MRLPTTISGRILAAFVCIAIVGQPSADGGVPPALDGDSSRILKALAAGNATAVAEVCAEGVRVLEMRSIRGEEDPRSMAGSPWLAQAQGDYVLSGRTILRQDLKGREAKFLKAVSEVIEASIAERPLAIESGNGLSMGEMPLFRIDGIVGSYASNCDWAVETRDGRVTGLMIAWH